VGFSGAYLQVSNSCIASINATDLDFGSVSSLTTARDSTSTITLTCPPNVNWKLGLNNGLHASSTQRRMAGPTGQYVEYELYRDAGRSQRWGNDTTGGTDTVNGNGSNHGQGSGNGLTVYGRVPAQPEAASGSYSDTVTITLTY
jgi:spore coat protein U-like protein